ncbi:MAG: hypothetical protein WCO37_11550 [Bacteroidota bacterium]|jgi:hypothetical protein
MNQLEKYFYAEKYESALFVLVGILAIAFAAYFLIKIKQPFYNGAAYPLIAVAFIQIVVGSSVYLRSTKDIVRVTEMMHTNSSKIQTQEIPRMNVVMKNFTLYRWVEIVVIISGIIVFLYFQSSSFYKGFGLGLLIQAGFLLLLDYFAERRGAIYQEYLQTLI